MRGTFTRLLVSRVMSPARCIAGVSPAASPPSSLSQASSLRPSAVLSPSHDAFDPLLQLCPLSAIFASPLASSWPIYRFLSLVPSLSASSFLLSVVFFSSLSSCVSHPCLLNSVCPPPPAENEQPFVVLATPLLCCQCSEPVAVSNRSPALPYA